MKTASLSVVIPFYNESGNIIPLYGEIRDTLKKDFSGWKTEIIMIDDGSSDSTWEDIKHCHKEDSQVRGIHLNRNYGQSVAMDAGFRAVR